MPPVLDVQNLTMRFGGLTAVSRVFGFVLVARRRTALNGGTTTIETRTGGPPCFLPTRKPMWTASAACCAMPIACPMHRCRR